MGERRRRSARMPLAVLLAAGLAWGGAAAPHSAQGLAPAVAELRGRQRPRGRQVLTRLRRLQRWRHAASAALYALLLSPEQFDFLQPIRVTTNDVLSFEGVAEPDPAVLLRWAARDRDRTMLFGAELAIEVRAP